jgi:6-phosphogluconolactonase
MDSSPRTGERLTQTVVTTDPEDLADKATALLLASIRDAVNARGVARVALSGGTTPRATHRALAIALRGEGFPVERIEWFFGDERWVAAASPESNEGMARETLLDDIRAPEATIHSWHAGVGEPRECARRYAATVRGGASPASPVFDLILLGMGADGHTASLFPGATAHLPDGRRLAVSADLPGDAVAIERPNAAGWRLTLCPHLLNACRTVAFLVTGADKAAALRKARGGAADTPAAWIRGEKTFFIVTRDTMDGTGSDGARDVRHA